MHQPEPTMANFRDQQAGRPFTDVITDLNDRIVALEEYMQWDEALRESSPALQDLYKKYQVTRKLIVK